jgi:cytochrome P450
VIEPRRDLAQRWENRVMRAAHPVAWPALRMSRAPVQRVPRLGVLVRDPAVLRATLMDAAHFSKTGPGAPSDLWTPVLGPAVLLNMEGADHLALRRTLGPLFAPSYVDPLVEASLPTASLTARLAAGEPVDLVTEAKRNASIMISQLVGIHEAQIDDELFQRVSSITRFVRLSRPAAE